MKILFVQTGGTIDKDYPKTNAGYAFEIDEPAVKRILEKPLPSFDFDVVSLFKKDSLEMNDEDRKMLKNFLMASEHSKIVITHGSDTMVETARYIGPLQGKLIMFTGSYRPERFKASDADFNVGVAVGALNVLKEGTFIAMNGMIMAPETCIKNPVTGLFETN